MINDFALDGSVVLYSLKLHDVMSQKDITSLITHSHDKWEDKRVYEGLFLAQDQTQITVEAQQEVDG